MNIYLNGNEFLMMSILSRFVKKCLISLPGYKGAIFALKVQQKVDGFVFNVIKRVENKHGLIHPKHRVTDFHDFFLGHINTSDAVVEIGCAYGDISAVLSKKARTVTGIDLRVNAIQKAREKYKIDNLDFECVNFLGYTEEKKFDVAVLSNVIEHIDDRRTFIEKAGSLANKVLIRVPAFDRDWMVAYKRSLGMPYLLNSDHRLEYTEEILRNELNDAGLTVLDLYCKWGNYCCVATKENLK